jgi:signal transduction histidine kinase
MRKFSANIHSDLAKFAELIDRQREALLARWREHVRRLPAAKSLSVPTLNDHIPPLLDELTSSLLSGHFDSVLDLHLENSPKLHGSERLRAGFDIVEVVAEYNILRELLQELAEESGIDISGDVNRILNRVIDRAVAAAVDSYAKEQAIEIQKRREEHLSFIMHDLRTPLSAMNTAGMILENSLSPEAKTDRVRNMLEVQKRNARRLSALLKTASQEHYNIAKGTLAEIKVEPREFDLWFLVEDIVSDLEPLSEQKAVRIINAVPEDFPIVADAILLTQVFQNLLSNAIKYTSAGQITIGAERTGPSIRCWVSDTGAGIPPERIGKIFEKLETDPDRKGGLGLGLAIVKEAVEAHGGEIEVQSGINQGSTFRFSLPQKRN